MKELFKKTFEHLPAALLAHSIFKVAENTYESFDMNFTHNNKDNSSSKGKQFEEAVKQENTPKP